MPFINPLRARWAAGQPTFSAWLSSGEPLIAEYLAGCGFDEVIADLQHGAIEVGHLPHLFAAVESRGVVPAARVPNNDPWLIGRVLDMGALEVMVPMVETAEEAARAVGACRYGPVGTRSMGPLRSMVTMKTFDPDELSQVVCLVQVETARGLENVDAIAATPGLDGIYIGPADLGLSLGLPGDWDAWTVADRERHDAAIRRIRESCVEHGIIPAIITGTGAAAARRVREGFRHVGLTSDLALISAAGSVELAAAREAAPAEAARPS